MKNLFFFLCIIIYSLTANAQNRNAVVKSLNNYIIYSNANITALSNAQTTLERYNGLFNDYLRKDRKLGGEAYEKPKPSPFLDEDVFTLNEDNPDYLFSIALKGSAGLPVQVKSDLNNALKSMRECSQKIVLLVDSMSNIFSGPMISVTKNPDALPYNLLFEIKNQLRLSKKYRDQLFLSINNYYIKTCPLNTSKTDYIQSVKPLTKGLEICQNMLNDFSFNDSIHISQNIQSLDSLILYLESSELELLKGIKPCGDSKHFPNKSYNNGFDLYSKFEDIVDQFRFFSNLGKKFIQFPNTSKHPELKYYYFHKDGFSKFNSTMGLLYHYNEYVLLIGGGKMKILAENLSSSRYIYKAWGDENHKLPARTLLFWMKETPRFEIEY